MRYPQPDRRDVVPPCARTLEMELKAIRDLFPITQKYVYLNHASLGPPSVQVVAAVEAYLSDLKRNGMVTQSDRDVWLGEVRSLAAGLIGADPAEVAFTCNTSQGILIVANGIDWRDGDNIVTAETEFSANVYPWLCLKRVGVETRLAPSRDGRISVRDITGLVDERTRLVALSFVEYWTGFRNDLTAIGQMCREKGIFFSVDAVQGLGALRLDVNESHVDFLSAAGYKWLLSPTGTGIFYCRRDLIDQLIPVQVSWRSVATGSYPIYEEPLWPDARRFEGGDLNWPGLHGLGRSLRLIHDAGPAWIEDRIRTLTDHLVEGLRVRGYQLISPIRSWQERSAIVTFDHATHSLADLHERLREARVIVDSQYTPGITSQYPPGIRVSPHFYNTVEEIDHLLEALP